MRPEVKRLCNRLQQGRARVLALVEATHEPERAVQPAEGKWSMLQVVEHLVLAEEATLRVFEKDPPRQPRVKISSVLALRAIEGLFGLRLRLPVPSPSLAPAAPDTLDPLRARWEKAADGIAQYAGSLEASELRQPRFRHPVAGWVTAGQGLDFLARHIRHHERQIHRVSRWLSRHHAE